MSLNQTPSSERVHIGFFGLRNAGKSSLVNAVTGQKLSLVSDVKGTTTDPVQKAMELLPLGPVVIIDTPGIDDEGELGFQRVERAKQTLNKVHIALLVTDATAPLTPAEEQLIAAFNDKKIPFIVVKNKSDLLSEIPNPADGEIYVSAVTGYNVTELKEKIAATVKTGEQRRLLADVVFAGQVVVLVTPIDESAPKGRLILPQQQTIRELLDIGATAIVTKETDLLNTLNTLKRPPDLVITDSQVFGYVAKILPPDMPLTSFSIIFARYKGDLEQVVSGAAALEKLKDGDKVLISEGCTHHRQCKDIGTVKLPGWVKKFSGKDITFEFTSGGEFKENLTDYALIIHCGGCMLNEKEMQNRLAAAKKAGVPITNYGTAIAHMNGILKRSIQPISSFKL